MRRAVAALLALVAACSDAAPRTAEVAAFPAAPRPALDVLLLIDDSVSVADHQRGLADALPALFAALAARPGGLPDLHIGVTTSDLGTTGAAFPGHPAPAIGTVGQNGGCGGAGDGGAFLIRGGASVTGPFISDVADGSGARLTNYTGDLSTNLGAIITGVGVNGCGFEQSLAAVGAALANPANTGFRRADAGLAVIVQSDEDDCSVRDPAFFGPSDTGPLGKLESFRCTTQGVTCVEPLDAIGPKTACEPSPANAFMVPADDLVAAVTTAEPDPVRRAVAAIIAPPTPFAIELRSPGMGAAAIPGLAHSCSYLDANGQTEVGDPAVRTAAWASALGGATYSICVNDYAPIVAALAKQLLAVVDGDPCVHGRLADGAATVCTVLEDSTPVPDCATAAAGATCWKLVADAQVCAGTETALRVEIDRTTPATPAATIRVACELARS